MNDEHKEFLKTLFFLGLIPILGILVPVFMLDKSGFFITENQWTDAVETQAEKSLGTIMIRSGAESYRCFSETPQLTKESLYTGRGYCYSKKDGIFIESAVTYTVERTHDLENIEFNLVPEETIFNGYTKIK